MQQPSSHEAKAFFKKRPKTQKQAKKKQSKEAIVQLTVPNEAEEMKASEKKSDLVEKNTPRYSKKHSVTALLKVVEEYDSMYREGYDGYIGIRSVPTDDVDSGKRLKMITICDISNFPEDQVKSAIKLASAYQKLHHENILNFIQPFRISPTIVEHGLMIFETEAPDHKLSWKTFSRHTFDLEQ